MPKRESAEELANNFSTFFEKIPKMNYIFTLGQYMPGTVSPSVEASKFEAVNVDKVIKVSNDDLHLTSSIGVCSTSIVH